MNQNSVDSDTEVDSHIYASSSSLVYNSDARKMALQHLRPKRENVENSKDFVINSRKILKKEISIQDKIEETQRLEGTKYQSIILKIIIILEFILMEQEKLAESKRAFDEDKERYKQYIEQLGIEAENIEKEVKGIVQQKNILQNRMKVLNDEIQHNYGIFS